MMPEPKPHTRPTVPLPPMPKPHHLPLGGSAPGTPGHPGDVYDCARCMKYAAEHPGTKLPARRRS